MEGRLEPPDLVRRTEAWVERQIDFSFMTGSGSDEVRKLLKAVQAAQHVGALSAIVDSADVVLDGGDVVVLSEPDAMAVSQQYLAQLHKLGGLTERLEWMYEQMAELTQAAPAGGELARDLEAAEAEPTPTLAPAPRQGGLFGWLRGRRP